MFAPEYNSDQRMTSFLDWDEPETSRHQNQPQGGKVKRAGVTKLSSSGAKTRSAPPHPGPETGHCFVVHHHGEVTAGENS